MTTTLILDPKVLAEAMHDADWPLDHRWADCAVEGHRDYYPRVAIAYASEYERIESGER